MNSLQPIAHIQNDFTAKFGIPRQSNIVDSVKSAIVFAEEYRNPEAFRGLETFSHIWLIWGFSQARRAEWSPTVRPPKLGGNTRMGVFATRSPYRPNSLGLSSVRLEEIEHHPTAGPVLHVGGADLMNGTPIYDIKPYLPFTDSHPDAAAGFLDPAASRLLQVEFAHRGHVPPETITTLRGLLAHDPRPSYHDDPGRVYGMVFGGVEVKFSVDGTTLTVHEIIEVK